MRRHPAVLHVMLFSCVWLAFAGCASADLSNGTPKKKPDKNAKVIPEARDATVKFGAGQSVIIELTAAVGSLKQVEFAIRTLPEHGTLSAIKPHATDNNKALVTYTHRAGEALTDSFSFSCKLEDNPSSAPAVITLVGQVLQPRLEVKQTPHMGKIAPGGESAGKVTVKNTGLAPFVGDITWPAPWTGPPHLEIKPGETQDFMIALRPTQSGVFRLELELQPGIVSSKLMSYGESLRALTASPGELTLAYNTITGAREGVLSLLNSEPEALTVVLKIPAPLTGPQRIDLLPRERRDVLLAVPATEIEAFRGEVELNTGPEVQRITVQAAPKPGGLVLVKPAEGDLNLGNVMEKLPATGVFVIRNNGGEPLIVEPNAFPPLSLDTGNSGFRLAPKEEKQIAVRLEGAPVGAFTSVVKLIAGSTTIPITVKATVTAAATSAASEAMAGAVYPKVTPTAEESAGRKPGMLNPHQAMLSTYLALNGLPPPEQALNRDLPRVEEIEGIAHTSSSVTIAWKKPGIMPAGWVIEFADYIVDKRDNVMTKAWRPWKNAKIIEGDKVRDKDKVVVQIHTLKPKSIYEIRIMALDRDGKVSVPSPVFQLKTEDSWHFPAFLLWLIILAVLSGMLYVLYRVRRGDFPAFA